MHLTLQTLSALAASLLFSTVSAFPRCHPGEAWPDVQDCHNFFECAAGGIPVLKTCGPGTAYSPVTGVCDSEFKIPSCHPHGPSPKGPGGKGHEQPQGHGDEGHEKPQGHDDEDHEEPQGHGDEGHEKPQGHDDEDYEQPQGQDDEGHEKPQGHGDEGHEQPQGQDDEDHEEPQSHGNGGHEQPKDSDAEEHEQPQGPAQGWPSGAGHHSHGGMGVGH